MKTRAKNLLRKFSIVLEFFIAGLLCIGILYYTFQLLGSTLRLEGFPVYGYFDTLLNTAFSLVIGIEIIRMMCEHSMEIVFEVLVFAIARQVVIDHAHAIDNLYGVAAIAILFAVKRFFIDKRPLNIPKKKAPEEPEHPKAEV